MSIKKFLFFALPMLILIYSTVGTAAPLPEKNAGSRLIVVFEPGTSVAKKRAIFKKSGVKVIHNISIIPAAAVHLPDQASETALNAILKHSSVARVEKDLIIRMIGKPEKPGGDKKPPKDEEPPPPPQSLPWGVDEIDGELAWQYATGYMVKVAILDTGIDTDHPDLVSNIAGGINILSPRKLYEDDNGHGTHVAGIIAAEDNSEGVVGVAKNAKIYGVKVLDRKGNGWLSDIIAGLEWSVANGVDVINMSLSTISYSQTFHDSVTAVYNSGIVIVAAAGNDGGDVNYPAAFSEAVAVSATDDNGMVTVWSSRGPEIDLAAPGLYINSTYRGGTYRIESGTSMAAPHVAGVVALILETRPALSVEEVRSILTSSADSLGLPEDQQGAGIVDAEEAAFFPE